MSHELRTPLNAIIGFSELLSGAMLGPLGHPRYREYARDIEASGLHLLAIVERMLDLSKSEAGQLSIAHERIQPGALLAKSVAMLAPIAAKGQVELALEGNPKIWPPISGDPMRLKQAFVNLVHNAIKFTPAGGRVTVSGSVDANRIMIRIADTGIGIEEQSIGLVLRPFHRLTSAFDGRYQGSGLGLPYAKAVVDLHGGSLSIQSTPRVGTVIVLDLPLDQEADRMATEAA
jgi:signal transduction histidine kinase